MLEELAQNVAETTGNLLRESSEHAAGILRTRCGWFPNTGTSKTRCNSRAPNGYQSDGEKLQKGAKKTFRPLLEGPADTLLDKHELTLSSPRGTCNRSGE